MCAHSMPIIIHKFEEVLVLNLIIRFNRLPQAKRMRIALLQNEPHPPFDNTSHKSPTAQISNFAIVSSDVHDLVIIVSLGQ